MPFGLSNTPLAFQRLINEVFSDLLDMCVVIYLDNILIYSDNILEHKEHVREVVTPCDTLGDTLYVSMISYQPTPVN